MLKQVQHDTFGVQHDRLIMPANFLTIIQIVVSVLLVVGVLLQQRGAGGSAITGGGETSYYTKRGMEKVIFIATIILAALFLITALANLLIK